MKRTIILILALALASCSVEETYERNILGVWEYDYQYNGVDEHGTWTQENVYMVRFNKDYTADTKLYYRIIRDGKVTESPEPVISTEHYAINGGFLTIGEYTYEIEILTRTRMVLLLNDYRQTYTKK